MAFGTPRRRGKSWTSCIGEGGGGSDASGVCCLSGTQHVLSELSEHPCVLAQEHQTCLFPARRE